MCLLNCYIFIREKMKSADPNYEAHITFVKEA